MLIYLHLYLHLCACLQHAHRCKLAKPFHECRSYSTSVTHLDFEHKHDVIETEYMCNPKHRTNRRLSVSFSPFPSLEPRLELTISKRVGMSLLRAMGYSADGEKPRWWKKSKEAAHWDKTTVNGWVLVLKLVFLLCYSHAAGTWWGVSDAAASIFSRSVYAWQQQELPHFPLKAQSRGSDAQLHFSWWISLQVSRRLTVPRSI